MKKILSKVLITTFLMIMSVCMLLPDSGFNVWGAAEEDEKDDDDDEDEYKNLLENGDAESGIGTLVDWECNDYNKNGEKVWKSTEATFWKNPPEGEKLFWPANYSKNYNSKTTEMYQEVDPKEDFKVGTWLHLSATVTVWGDPLQENDKAILRLELLDDDDHILDYGEAYTQNSDWTKLEIFIKVPSGAYKAKVICKGILNQGSTIDTYFDDIRLVALDKPYGAVQISGNRDSGNKGDTIQLNATDGTFKSASDYKWSVSYDDLAKVDDKGLVTILDSSEEVTVYARNKNTGIVGSFKINSGIDVSKNTTDSLKRFELKKDNNNFIHTNTTYLKISDDEQYNYSADQKQFIGFEGRKDYSFNDASLFDRLTQYSSKGNKAEIVKEMKKEWEGSCYGLSATMALVYEGKMKLSDLSNDKNAKSYYDLKRPADDSKFSDWINYLYLSQLLGYGGDDDLAISKTDRVDEWYYNSDSLEQFLKELVTYSLNGHVGVFGFRYSDENGQHGHAVLVTGCKKDPDNPKDYIIDIYDQNDVRYLFTDDYKDVVLVSNLSDKKYSKLLKHEMKVRGDFSGFTTDWKLWDNSKEKYMYKFMEIIDTDKLYQYVVEQKKYNTPSRTCIVIPARSGEYKLVFKEKTLIYDGYSLSGTLEIQGIDYRVGDSDDMDGGDSMVIYIEPVDGLIFTELSDEADISVYTDDDFVSFSGKNIEEAKVDFGKGVELKGTNMEFETYVLAEDDIETGKDLNLIKVSGNASSDIDISIHGSDLAVNTEGTLENVTTAALSGTETVERAFTGVTSEFKIDSDAKVDNATEIAMVRMEGLTTIDTSGDIGVLGLSTTTNSKNISQAVIKLSKDTYTYNGKKKKPTVTVELGGKVLTASKDYKVSYKNNKNVGTATLTIKGIGDYNGTISRTFKIVPKATSLSKISASGETISVKWKKQTKSVTGYEIQYSTSKSFTKKTTVTVTVAGAKKTKTTISGLKSGKKYYVRVRTYKVVNGKKYYSGWSKVKNVKVK